MLKTDLAGQQAGTSTGLVVPLNCSDTVSHLAASPMHRLQAHELLPKRHSSTVSNCHDSSTWHASQKLITMIEDTCGEQNESRIR
jgi:hypothetical protein